MGRFTRGYYILLGLINIGSAALGIYNGLLLLPILIGLLSIFMFYLAATTNSTEEG